MQTWVGVPLVWNCFPNDTISISFYDILPQLSITSPYEHFEMLSVYVLAINIYIQNKMKFDFSSSEILRLKLLHDENIKKNTGGVKWRNDFVGIPITFERPINYS